MKIGSQIKKYRQEAKLSQEELAEKIYVTQQTISNWENDKNYPDINSIVLLSNLFGISLDILVKGDVESMKEQISEEALKKWNQDGKIFTALLFITVILAVPLFLFLGIAGIVIWLALFGVTMYFAHRVEKQKKEHDIQTYKEILAFTEGKKLDEIEKIRESGKRPYQKIVAVVASGVIGLVIAGIMCLILL